MTRTRSCAPERARFPCKGILTDGGTILLDPNVVVKSSNGGGPPIGGNATVTRQRLPALLSPGASLGNVVHGDLFAQQGDVAVFFVGIAADALAASPYGMIWWDLNGPWVVSGIGVVDARAHLQHDLPVPMDFALAGPVWVRQAMTLSPSDPWLLSNPAEYVIHWRSPEVCTTSAAARRRAHRSGEDLRRAPSTRSERVAPGAP